MESGREGGNVNVHHVIFLVDRKKRFEYHALKDIALSMYYYLLLCRYTYNAD